MKFYSKSANLRPSVENEMLSIASAEDGVQSGTKTRRRNSKGFYITTAIPYVNAAPHIGHALEFVQGDAIARFHKLIGDQTAFLSGADENALKIVQAAQRAGLTPQQLANENSEIFQKLAKVLDVEFDYFQRGTDKKHHFTASQKLWKLCNANGDIFKKTYEGLYCVGCEAFYTRNELSKDGLCPEHLIKPESVREENYFFKLSKFQNQLLDLIQTGKLKIIPNHRKNEVVSFIKQGLEDFSISRSIERAKGWGVPVPNDPKQIIYVWFDALNIYQSGIGFGWNEKNYNKWWPADVHLIGKGIIRFHAVYWPAILLSAGLKLPKTILVHGYITIDHHKMSKSLGNVVDPFVIIRKYGVDPIRYYLLREIPTYADGDFSENRFKELYNADLANTLGNLISRIAKIASNTGFSYKNQNSFKQIIEKNPDYKKAILAYDLSATLTYVLSKTTQVNLYIDTQKPWQLSPGEKLDSVLNKCSNEICEIAFLLMPFTPKTSENILNQFSGRIKSQKPLFPRND